MGRSTLACLILLAAAGCSRFEVNATQDPQVAFSDFASFAWMPLDVAPPFDRRLQDRSIERVVRAGIERGMAAKGYVAGADGEADLLVTYRLVSTERQVAGAPRGYALDGTGSWLYRGVSSQSYERGSLVVDLYDARARRLAWRGVASARLLPHKSYEYRVKRATQAVDQIMADVPAR